MNKLKIALLMGALLAMVVVTSAFAGPAYQASFTTSITYQNVGTETANIVFSFQNENTGTQIGVSRDLNAGGGASLAVGNLNEITAGFRGSAVMSSNQPVVATMVQVSSDPDVKNRPLSNGFSGGASEVLLASVLKNQFNTTSRFSVQNAHSTPVDLTVRIYNAANPSADPIVVTHNNLPVGAAKYFDAGTLSAITAASLNGSATVTAVETGTQTPANIVATVLELSTNGPAVSSFEGINEGANKIYMATALCQSFGGTSFYAVQNVGDAATTVTVTYSSGEEATSQVAPGAKASFNGCAVNDPGFSGAATIEATQPIVAIGKVSGGGLSTAFNGAAAGANKLALPYVRFTTANWNNGSQQRAFVAIQNVGDAATNITVQYVDKNGTVQGTHTFQNVAPGAKVNTNPNNAAVSPAPLPEFGNPAGNVNAGGGFGGAAIVQAGEGGEIVAVVRIVSNVGGGQSVGEDYNGIAID
jgi:hypothetical protein